MDDVEMNLENCFDIENSFKKNAPQNKLSLKEKLKEISNSK